MPEFEELKPVDSKTDYELKSGNNPKKSEPADSAKKSRTGLDRPAVPRRARRSRYHSAYRKPRSGPIKPPSKPMAQEPASGSEDRQKPERSKPPPRKRRRPHAKAGQGKRPPRSGQQRHRNRGGSGGPRKKGDRRRSDRRSGHRGPARSKATRHGKPPAPKGLFASILSRLKSLFGIKEPEPERPKRKHHRNRRRSKNYRPNKPRRNRPNRPSQKGGGSKRTAGQDTQPKRRPPRRRRRRRGGPPRGGSHPQKNLTGRKTPSNPSPSAASRKNPPSS